MPSSPDPSAVRTFLESPARPAGTLCYHELEGFLFAIVSAPELIPPSDWLPIIFGEKDAGDVLANFEEGAPIGLWSRGFLLGHQWLEELWEEYVPEELAEELDATLMALGFFSSRHMAESFHAEATTGEQSFEAMADAMHRIVPRAVAQYAHLGRSIATVLAEDDPDEAEATHDVKVGRNAPCPCGSGKKYKKCCGPTVH